MGMRTMATVKRASFVTTPLCVQSPWYSASASAGGPLGGGPPPRPPPPSSSVCRLDERMNSREVCMAFWRGFCCAEMVRDAREGYSATKHDPGGQRLTRFAWERGG